MNIYTHGLARALVGLSIDFLYESPWGVVLLPEGAEVVERAVHVVEARRRPARECVERPVHRRERGRGDLGGLRVELNLRRGSAQKDGQLRGECSFSSFPGFAV